MRVGRESGRAGAGAEDGPARGRGGLWHRRRLHREVRRLAAPHRVPGARRSLRQRRLAGRARVLDPAPAPETARRVPVGRAHREDPPEDGRRGRRRGQGGPVRQRRHVRVPDGQGRPVLLHGGEHAPPGRAPGHRDGHRHRHREGTDPGGGRRAAVVQAVRGHLHGTRDRVPHQRRGPGAVHAVAGHHQRLLAARAARACASTRPRTPTA